MVTNHKPTVVDKERDKSAINKFLTKVNWGDQARQINFGYYRNALLFQPHYVLVPTFSQLDLQASKQAARELAIAYGVKPGLLVDRSLESQDNPLALEIALQNEGLINFWID